MNTPPLFGIQAEAERLSAKDCQTGSMRGGTDGLLLCKYLTHDMSKHIDKKNTLLYIVFANSSATLYKVVSFNSLLPSLAVFTGSM